jgi:hypothetical protein
MFSCDKSGLFVNCYDCSEEEPYSTDLEIKIDELALTNAITMISIYAGNLEDSILLESYNVRGTDITYEAVLNKQYTVTATYYTPDGTFIAVDSTIPRVRYETDQCTVPCYFVYGKKLNLRLKYIK